MNAMKDADKPYFSGLETVRSSTKHRCGKCRSRLVDEHLLFWGHFDNVQFEIRECIECAGPHARPKTADEAFSVGPLFQ